MENHKMDFSTALFVEIKCARDVVGKLPRARARVRIIKVYIRQTADSDFLTFSACETDNKSGRKRDKGLFSSSKFFLIMYIYEFSGNLALSIRETS